MKEKIPGLKDMELDKLDLIILQLQTISRELIFSNAKAKQELLSDRSVKEIYDLCADGPTDREVAERTGRNEQRVKEVLDTLWRFGLVETFVDEQGEIHYEETVPKRLQWYVACRNYSITLCPFYPSANQGYCRHWGPFPSEPHARAFANANFPGWRCTC